MRLETHAARIPEIQYFHPAPKCLFYIGNMINYINTVDIALWL